MFRPSSRRRLTPRALGVLALAGTAGWAPAGAQTVHVLEAGPKTVAYGYYWSEAKPVLRIKSGDIVDVTTMSTSSPTALERAGVAANDIPQAHRAIMDSVPQTDRGPGGHILTGPVFVEGAEPGDVLEIKILSIELPYDHGSNGCSGFVPTLCPRPGGTRIFRFDRQKMTTEFAPGITIPLRPFFGSMGVAPPPSVGRWSSNPPWIHGGNMDNKELVAGTTLYIPVHVAGALFEVGDGHAAQGDGEVDQTAIETYLRGRLQLTVRKDMKLDWPVAETPTHWITMGTDRDLTEATKIAITNTATFLENRYSLPKGEGYRLISLAVDLSITELVDGYVGVHAMIPKSLFRQP